MIRSRMQTLEKTHLLISTHFLEGCLRIGCADTYLACLEDFLLAKGCTNMKKIHDHDCIERESDKNNDVEYEEKLRLLNSICTAGVVIARKSHQSVFARVSFTSAVV